MATMATMATTTTTTMAKALENIFEAYRYDVVKARRLVDH